MYKWPPCHRCNEEVFVGAWSERWDWSGPQNIALVHVRPCQPALHNPAITPTAHSIISPSTTPDKTTLALPFPNTAVDLSDGQFLIAMQC